MNSVSAIMGLVVIGGEVSVVKYMSLQVPVKYVMDNNTIIAADYNNLNFTLTGAPSGTSISSTGIIMAGDTEGNGEVTITYPKTGTTLYTCVVNINIVDPQSGSYPAPLPLWISTDIEADAASDVKVTTPKAVKTYVDGSSPILRVSSIVNDDTTGGTAVPLSAEVGKTHGTQISQLTKQITTPTGFAWTDHPLISRLWHDRSGNYYTDYDVSENEITGKAYYVSLSGNDANDGLTASTPLLHLYTAVAKADVDVIWMAPGVYQVGMALNGNAITRSMSIKSTGGRVVISGHAAYSWTLTSGKTNTYQAAASNVTRVFDASVADEYGDYDELTLAESIDAVEATPGTWYISGGVVYIHTTDSRNPGTTNLDIRCFKNNTGANSATGNISIYLDGLDFEGGTYPFSIANSAAGQTPHLYAKNCRFKYSTAGNAIRILGANAILQNCEAARSLDDGFNYHVSNSVIPYVVEIGCVGRHNGESGDIDNGSTIHDGGKIIRVNGRYFKNKGPNVGDINTDSMSWNIGCNAYDNQSASINKANYCAHTGSKMWLEGCSGHGSKYNIIAEGSTAVHTRDCDIRMIGAESIDVNAIRDNY